MNDIVSLYCKMLVHWKKTFRFRTYSIYSIHRTLQFLSQHSKFSKKMFYVVWSKNKNKTQLNWCFYYYFHSVRFYRLHCDNFDECKYLNCTSAFLQFHSNFQRRSEKHELATKSGAADVLDPIRCVIVPARDTWPYIVVYVQNNS